MRQNRREFITATASLGVLGVAIVSADAQRARARPRVAVVHGTAFGGQNRENFIAGLRKQGWEATGANRNVDLLAPRDAQGEYGRKDDDQRVRKIMDLANLAAANSPELVVAAGGLIAAIETARALETKNIPFVFLVGRVPKKDEFAEDTDEGFFYKNLTTADTVTLGGVDLNSIEQNEQRVDKLKAESSGAVTDANVCLVYNANAQMAEKEVAAWTAGGRHSLTIPLFSKSGNKKNEHGRLRKQLQDGFGALSTRPLGLVVSSDPFLRYFRGRFDDALHAANGGNFNDWVCYPFQEYLEMPARPKTFFLGPQLAPRTGIDEMAAYFKLGEKAGEALNNRRGGNPLRKVVVHTY